ncbi:uncharacterized protein [Engystomops pustulosus]|uniref:uncharacterized protein isoform X2 n=1 Tax=Engystomops pustulosus TaxID=76066 RepID=UPI003AFA2F2F
MKIIILFALAGLSLAVERSCYVTSGSRPTDAECVEIALNNVPAFTIHLAIFLGTYQGKITRNEEKFRAATKELILILKSVCCNLEAVLDIPVGQTFEEALAAARKTLEDVARELFELLDTLQLSDGATDLLCTLADDALLSKSMTSALRNDVSLLPDNLKAFICKRDRNAVTAKDVEQLLRNIGCFGDDALGTGDTVGIMGPSDLACSVIPIVDDGIGDAITA